MDIVVTPQEEAHPDINPLAEQLHVVADIEVLQEAVLEALVTEVLVVAQEVLDTEVLVVVLPQEVVGVLEVLVVLLAAVEVLGVREVLDLLAVDHLAEEVAVEETNLI